MLLAALYGWQRLGQSVWGDEDYTIKTYIEDQVTEQTNGSLRFEKPSWASALWNFKRPNNHVGFTVLAKACHDWFFTPGTGPRDSFFSEPLVRAPAYLAGVLSVAALWWLAGVYGWQGGAVAALLFLYVQHPWYVRFSSDARGYSLLLLLIPLCLGAAGRAVQTGQWRWWCLLAGCQFYAMWTWVSSIYVIASLNLALPCMCWFASGWSKEERKTLLLRWLASGLMTAIAVVLIMAPLFPQLRDFMRSGAKGLEGGMNAAWGIDMLGYTWFGTPWYPWLLGNPLCVSIQQSGLTVVYVLAGVGMLLLWVYGSVRLWKEEMQRWLLVVSLAAPLFMFLHLGLTSVKPYHWYLLLFLPGWLILVLPVLQSAVEPMLARGRCLLLLALLVTVSWLAAPQRQMLLRYPIEANRESVFLTRQITNPRHPQYGSDSITAGFTMFTEAYDPTMVRFQTKAELEELIQKARDTKRDLFINFSSRGFCEANYPELFQLFNDKHLFESKAVLPGQFAASTREVLCLRK
jgi:hypothetical protein